MSTEPRKWEQDEYSGARIHLYSFFQKIDWCVNGKKTKVKKVHGIEYGETYVLFWFYRGLSTSSISGGHGQSYYRRSAQGIFEFCFVEPILCVQQHQILHDNTVQP